MLSCSTRPSFNIKEQSAKIFASSDDIMSRPLDEGRKHTVVWTWWTCPGSVTLVAEMVLWDVRVRLCGLALNGYAREEGASKEKQIRNLNVEE